MKRELSRELSSTCWLPGKDTEQQPEIRCRGLDKYILVLDHTFYGLPA